MRVAPIYRTVFSQRKPSQSWKVSDSCDSLTLENTEEAPGFYLEKHNKNKYLQRPLTLPQSCVIFIK